MSYSKTATWNPRCRLIASFVQEVSDESDKLLLTNKANHLSNTYHRSPSQSFAQNGFLRTTPNPRGVVCQTKLDVDERGGAGWAHQTASCCTTWCECEGMNVQFSQKAPGTSGHDNEWWEIWQKIEWRKSTLPVNPPSICIPSNERRVSF